MDGIRLGIVLLAAGAGWLVGIPLLWLADHLLASVVVTEAAPVALVPASSGRAQAGDATLPPVLGRRWRWALHGGLAVTLPLVLWRLLATPAFHPASFLAAATLVICVMALVAIAVLDGATHLVFLELVIPPAALVALVSILAGASVWKPLLIGGMVGGGLFLGLYALGYLLYATDALGFGDVELAAAFGVMLGWPVLLSGLVLGMLAMAVVTCLLLALRRISAHTYIPIGLFLAVGTVVTLLTVPPSWLA